MLGMLLRARYRLRPRTTTAKEERIKVLERGVLRKAKDIMRLPHTFSPN